MPTHQCGYKVVKHKRYGCYAWGEHGKKYWYLVGNEKQRREAKRKAHLQGIAIKAHGFKE